MAYVFVKGNLDDSSINPAKRRNDVTAGNVEGFFPKEPRWNPCVINSVSKNKPACQGWKVWPLRRSYPNYP